MHHCAGVGCELFIVILSSFYLVWLGVIGACFAYFGRKGLYRFFLRSVVTARYVSESHIPDYTPYAEAWHIINSSVTFHRLTSLG